MKTATQYAISPKAINVSTAVCMFKILIRKSSCKIDLPLNLEKYQRTNDPLLLTPTNSQRKCAHSNGDNKDSNEVSSIMLPVHKLDPVDDKGEPPLPYAQAFRLLSQFVTVLKYQVEVARKSLLQAAFEAPIHGILYCIREVLCDLDLGWDNCSMLLKLCFMSRISLLLAVGTYVIFFHDMVLHARVCSFVQAFSEGQWGAEREIFPSPIAWGELRNDKVDTKEGNRSSENDSWFICS